MYDGTTVATLGGTATVAAFGSDVVTVGGTGSGAFADSSIGAGKAVTVSGFAFGGTDAGNYTIVQPTGVTADITAFAAPPPAATPVSGVLTQQLPNILSPQMGGQSSTLGMSPTITVTGTGAAAGAESGADEGATVDVTLSRDGTGPSLHIANGGVRLPRNMLSSKE